MVLGNYKTGTHRTDKKPKEQKAFVALTEGHAKNRNRANQQQTGVSLAWSDAIAQWTDDEPHQDGDGDRRNINVGDLIHAQSQLALDQGHERGAGEPGKEADEKGHPREMECAHLRRGQAVELDARGLGEGFGDRHGQLRVVKVASVIGREYQLT